MMANGYPGGDFDGGGSVRWEIVTEDDDGQGMDVRGRNMKVVEEPFGGRGKRNRGADRHHHTDFRVILKVPRDPRQREAFLKQFNVPEKDGMIEVRLPIAKVDQQIMVRWTDPHD
jgi:hypothetical protein